MEQQPTIVLVTPAQVRAARGFLGLSQTEFAEAVGVGRSTIAFHEQGNDLTENVSKKIRRYCRTEGIRFKHGGIIIVHESQN